MRFHLVVSYFAALLSSWAADFALYPMFFPAASLNRIRTDVFSSDYARKPYPSDLSDEEWEFVAPYLSLLPLDARQRDHDLREIFNGLRWLVRSGASWRLMPHDLPPWHTVYQQTQRGLKAGCLEAMARCCFSFLPLRGQCTRNISLYEDESAYRPQFHRHLYDEQSLAQAQEAI